MITREGDTEKVGDTTYHNEYHDTITHPPGFKSIYLYNAARSRVIDEQNHTQYLEQEPFFALTIEASIEFYIKDGYPTLPILKYNKIWCIGWDIPINYAIDSDKQCWMNDAHGGGLYKVKTSELLGEFKNKQDRVKLEKFLGLPESYIQCSHCGSLVDPRFISKTTEQ